MPVTFTATGRLHHERDRGGEFVLHASVAVEERTDQRNCTKMMVLAQISGARMKYEAQR